MRTLILLPLLLSPLQNAAPSAVGAPVAVLAFKWTKSRQTVATPPPATTAPAPEHTRADKNFERNRRVNDPAGVREPNADSIDTRSAALERSVQESRSAKGKPVDGFAYRVRVRNAGAKPVEVVFWEYRFTEASNPSNVARRQFLCGVQIKPEKEKELQAFGVSGPNVVSVESLAEKSGNSYQEEVVINRVEYADGTIWQRAGWNFAEVKSAVARAVATPWGTEMCRGL
ncbi:MAG TPA: hypothetical protein VER08_06340 [Pyrinomonadaceae bacterium]|nr:hypothetical protein [Pyrinomonadaceae bacterium]